MTWARNKSFVHYEIRHVVRRIVSDNNEDDDEDDDDDNKMC